MLQRPGLVPYGIVNRRRRAFAVYSKQIGNDGETLQYTKITYLPDGKIAHVKDKITGVTIK